MKLCTIVWNLNKIELIRGSKSDYVFIPPIFSEAIERTCRASMTGWFSVVFCGLPHSANQSISLGNLAAAFAPNSMVLIYATSAVVNSAISTGCSRKNCTKFMHHNFATVCHRVMWFSANYSERNCSHDKGHCLNTTIKYSLFCGWQVNYLKTRLAAKSLRQICGINKVCALSAFQN